MSHDYKSAQRPQPDELLVAIADYTKNFKVDSAQSYETAKYCLMDTLACGFQALKYPACTKLLGPVVPGATMPGGSRVPGTSYELDPVMGAFSIGVGRGGCRRLPEQLFRITLCRGDLGPLARQFVRKAGFG